MAIEDAKVEVHDALRLLGNASAQISTVQRKKVLKALNPNIQDLVSEEGHFTEAAPMLFGENLRGTGRVHQNPCQNFN